MARFYLALIVVLVLSWPAAPAAAQTAKRSITVTGMAEKELLPDRYSIKVAIQVEGKTTELARAEYRKKIDQVRSAFNDMDFPDLSLVSAGRTISDLPQIDSQQMQIMMMGDNLPDATAQPLFYIREELQFQWRAAPQTPLTDLEQGLGNLLDRIRAEKLNFSGIQAANYYPLKAQNLVSGEHSQIRAELRALRTGALEDAKSQAAEIAALTGDKLGRILEVTVPPEEPMSEHGYAGRNDEAPGPFTCSLGSKIQLKSTVRVTFELE